MIPVFLGFIHTTLAHPYKKRYRKNIHNITFFSFSTAFSISLGPKAQANITYIFFSDFSCL